MSAMLRPKPLAAVLRQATTGGVDLCMLMKKDGSLLCYAVTGDKDAQVHAALASNIWSSYGGDGSEGEEQESVMIECETGKLVLVKVATILLCITSDTTVGFGMLKAKAAALVKVLDEPLSKVDMMID